MKSFTFLTPRTPYDLKNIDDILVSIFRILDTSKIIEENFIFDNYLFTTPYGFFKIYNKISPQEERFIIEGETRNIRIGHLEIILVFKPFEGRNILIHILKDFSSTYNRFVGDFRLYPHPNGLSFTDTIIT